MHPKIVHQKYFSSFGQTNGEKESIDISTVWLEPVKKENKK